MKRGEERGRSLSGRVHAARAACGIARKHETDNPNLVLGISMMFEAGSAGHLIAQLGDRQGWLVAAAVAVVTTMLLLRARRRMRGQRRDTAPMVRTPRPGAMESNTGTSADAPPQLARWEVEMHETARRLSAQLDSKMSALQALTAEADRAASRLEAALDRAEGGERDRLSRSDCLPGPIPGGDRPGPADA